MRIFYPEHHALHHPVSEIENGEAIPHEEVPERIIRIRRALIRSGRNIEPVTLHVPMSLLTRVHTPAYMRAFQKFSNTVHSVQIPSVFPYHGHTQTNHRRAQFGAISFDTYTPILPSTYTAAKESASAAYQAACAVHAGSTASYAVCRPPGHHAGPDYMGGYCYINNAGVAAEYLSAFGKVAVVDVDFHHGNGTQDIFYERSDVLFVSLHADPSWKFPYFTGTRTETGSGKGKGYTVNFPLNKGTTDTKYDGAFVSALKKVRAFHPSYLVVSLGFDTHVDDPIGGFRLTTPYYRQMAKRFVDLAIPTVFVQEGGYNTEALGANAASFFSAIS